MKTHARSSIYQMVPCKTVSRYHITRWSSIPTGLIYSMIFMMNDNEHSIYQMVPCKTIYLHLRAASTINEVAEGITRVGLEVIINVRRPLKDMK